MNDEELGRALGTALAAPELTAAPDAGARLRTRARRRRTEVAVLSTVVVAVLGLLVGVGVVRATTGAPPPDSVAAGPVTGLSRLSTTLYVDVSRGADSCINVDPRCATTTLTLADITGVSTSELPESGAIVLLTLTGDDAATLRGVAVGDRELTVRAAELTYPATAPLGQLRINVGSPRAAAELVSTLGPVRAPAPRTGPGRLDVPLELWNVVGTDSEPCSPVSTAPDRLVTDRAGVCLTLAGPGLSIDTADLELTAPAEPGQDWLVSVGGVGIELDRFTSEHVGDRIAFVAGGRVYGGTPELVSVISQQFQIPFSDRASAEALITRLRR